MSKVTHLRYKNHHQTPPVKQKPKLRSLQLQNKLQLQLKLRLRLLIREKQINPKRKNQKEFLDPKEKERLRLPTMRSEWQPKVKSKIILVTPSEF